jgi:hypothetical protein
MKHRCRKLAWGIVHAAIISSQFTSTLRAFENTADKSSSKHEPLVLKSTASDESAPVATNPPAVPGNANPAVRIVADAATPQLAFLGVDTERGERVAHNILRAPIHLLLRGDAGATTPLDELPCVVEHDDWSVRYRIKVADDVTLVWKISTGQGQFRMSFHKLGAGKSRFTGVDLVLPLEPKTCATSIISGQWFKNEEFALPAILSAPDLGQLYVNSHDNIKVDGSFVGERGSFFGRPNSLDLTFRVGLTTDRGGWIDFSPLVLPTPKGIDQKLWRQARRGWFNMFQLSSHWQRPGNARGAPAGIIANNVLSDPVSSLLWFHGDQALLLPELAPGVRATDVLRHTIEFWLNEAVEPDGQVWYVAGQKYQMMDANPAVLIAAWCYVEATGDHKWAEKNLPRLELIADYLAGRDIDHDGLCESVQSGNAGANAFPGDTSIDTIFSGHKNAWVNALVFRAWRCLADIETKLHRSAVADRYRALSDKLRTAYAPRFFDPSTGKLAWWISADGKVHDYGSVLVASYAVEYGLLDQAQSRAVINGMWKQIDAVKYGRFDIGLPLNLVAVPPAEQCNPGGPDAFGHYCNGGVFPQFAVNTMTASWRVGQTDRADKMLDAMLKRQDHGVFPNGGGFQCGITDKMGTGPEIYDWNGATTGYEGHCVRDCSFVMGLLLRDPDIRAKVYRPIQ